MGLFDLSVPELYQYQGTNPKPADFDAYWERGLAEMNDLDPAVTLTPAYRHPAFDCFDLYFTGTKGARVYAKWIVPKHWKQPVPAVLQFHGYTGSSGDWTGLMQLAAAGFAVAALDVRGQGGKSQDAGGVIGNTYHGHIIRGLESENPDDLLYRDVFLDTALLYKIVAGMDCVDADKIAEKLSAQVRFGRNQSPPEIQLLLQVAHLQICDDTELDSDLIQQIGCTVI